MVWWRGGPEGPWCWVMGGGSMIVIREGGGKGTRDGGGGRVAMV